MKKLASVLGVGVISMAVALSPAFAQVKASEPAGPPAAVQSKPADKVPVPGAPAKEEKKTPAEMGSENKAAGVPAKPAPDVKADSKTAPAKPGADTKSDAKQGNDSKAAATPAKPAPDVKPGKADPAKPDTRSQSAPAKQLTGGAMAAAAEKPAQDSKGDVKVAPVKPDAAKTGTDTKSGAVRSKTEPGSKAAVESKKEVKAETTGAAKKSPVDKSEKANDPAVKTVPEKK